MARLPRKTSKEKVKEHLMKKILMGEFRPGDRITETGIAAELEVSQAVVREAFADLRARNILEVIPYKETRIKGYNKGEVADAIRVRNEVEVLAFRWVLEKKDLSSLTEDLEDLLERMKACMEAKDGYAFRRIDVAFHRRIFEESGSPTLISFWDMLGDAGWIYAGIFRGHLFSPEEEPTDGEILCKAYEDIIRAVKERDQETFAALINRWKVCLDHGK